MYLFINFSHFRFTKNCKMTPKAKFEWTTHENKLKMQLNNNTKCTRGAERRGEERERGRWEKLIKNYAIFYLAWNTLRMRNVYAWNWIDRNCLCNCVSECAFECVFECVSVCLRVSVCALLCVACKSFYSFCDNLFFNYVCIKVSTEKHRRKSLKNNWK